MFYAHSTRSLPPRVSGFLLVLWFCASPLIALGADVHSNGTGGGAWSDAATWRTKAVPTADDSVAIAAGDTVQFDRDDSAKVTCKDLALDPDSTLTFKSGGKRVLAVAGLIDSYGAIRITAPDDGDFMELRLTGDSADKRIIRLERGGSLSLLGRPDMAEGEHNVLLSSKPALAKGAPAQPSPTGSVEAITGTGVDLEHAQVSDIVVKATGIDNTGAKPGERVNVSDCLFGEAAELNVIQCDTAAVVNNTFRYTGEAALPTPAITLNSSPLMEIRGNTFTGKYTYAIQGYYANDAVVSNNTIDNCPGGIFWAAQNGMLKNNTIRGCYVGIVVTSMTGIIEDSTIDGCRSGLQVAGATLQCTDLRITNPQKDGNYIDFYSGPLTLINCDIKPEQIKLNPQNPLPPVPRVTTMQYLVVGIKDATPGLMVEVVTAKPAKPLAAGATDPNVRNSPARVGANGITPVPKALNPLMVKSWGIEADNKITPAPEYTVTVTVPPVGPDGKGKVIKTVNVTPQPSWYRSNPQDGTPTTEISLK